MADGKKDAKKTDDAKEAAPAGADDDAKKKKKKLFMLIGVAVLLIVVSIGGTIGAMKLLSPGSDSGEEHSSDSEDSDDEGSDQEDSDEDHSGAESGDEHGEGKKSKKHKESHDAAKSNLPATYLLLQPNFTVNYDVDGKQRYLQTEISLMYREESVLKVLELHMPAVRNGIVLSLSRQQFPNLQTSEGRENLRVELLATIQEILAKEQSVSDDKEGDKSEEKPKSKKKSKVKKSLPSVEQVLFTQFVMQ
jgi:flagellar protein FliL